MTRRALKRNFFLSLFSSPRERKKEAAALVLLRGSGGFSGRFYGGEGYREIVGGIIIVLRWLGERVRAGAQQACENARFGEILLFFFRWQRKRRALFRGW